MLSYLVGVLYPSSVRTASVVDELNLDDQVRLLLQCMRLSKQPLPLTKPTAITG